LYEKEPSDHSDCGRHAGNTVVWGRAPNREKREHGHLTSDTIKGARPCLLDGCYDTRVCVKWPGERWTWPCLGAMDVNADGEYVIL